MPVSEEGHQYSFGPPAGGWPSFGPDGRVQKGYVRGLASNPELAKALVSILAPDGRIVYVREEHAQELWDLFASGASNDEIDEWVAEVLP